MVKKQHNLPHYKKDVEISDARSVSVNTVPKFEIWESLTLSIDANKYAYIGIMGTTGMCIKVVRQIQKTR